MMLCLLASMSPVTAYINPESRTVRVGCYLYDGFFEVSDDGAKNGYGYAFLRYMARYNNWRYEYVPIDVDNDNAYQMLKDGEIDMLMAVENETGSSDDFITSTKAIGSQQILLTTSTESDKLVLGDFTTYEGMNVGIVEGNTEMVREFDLYAHECGFAYNPVYYKTFEEMKNELNNGENIDCMLSYSTRTISNEWIYAIISVKPLYFYTLAENNELMTEINASIANVYKSNPDLQNILEDEFYMVKEPGDLALTSVEADYLKTLVESGKKLTAVVNPDRIPISYFNSKGELQGVMGDVVEKLEQLLGLEIEVIYTENREQYYETLNSGYPTLRLDDISDWSNSENFIYETTDGYLEMSIAILTRKDFTDDIKKVAVLTESDMKKSHISVLLDDKEVVNFPSSDECIYAVINGEVDAFYTFNHCAQYAANADNRHRLISTSILSLSFKYAVGVNENEDYRLLSIINKAVKCLGDGYLDDAIYRNTIYTSTGGIIGYMYDNPLAFSAFALLFCTFLALAVILMLRMKSEATIKRNSSELKRFIKYVCNANESVVELNLTTMQGRWYTVENGELVLSTNEFFSWDNYDEYIYPEDYKKIKRDLTLDTISQLIEENGEYYFEARARDGHGDYKWSSFLLQAIEPDEYHPRNIVVFKKNIDAVKQSDELYKSTLRDALETARKASKTKGMFMSRMSHEIRTPLNAVLGYISMAKSSSNNLEKINDYIYKCEAAAKHLLGIINDVLDIASIESGKFKISHEGFDMKALITGISTMFYSQAKNKGVNLSVNVNGLSEEWVIGDQLRVNQILINLLSNAIKFTSSGGNVSLTVDQLSIENNKVNFRFTVSDTGIGMSKQFMDKIFTPFEQESGSVARNFGGTGLGLSITRNLVDLMDGAIDVRSEQGKGTVFTVYLALDYTESKRKKQGNSDFSSVWALVVENENDGKVTEMIKGCGAKCTRVSTSDEAVNQIRRRQNTDYEYNMCIMEWKTESIDGIETSKRIRDELGCMIPIAIVCPCDASEIRDECIEAGVDKIIPKPLFQSTIFDMLVNTFGKYQIAKNEDIDYTIENFRVLVVEDNVMNMEIACEMLTRNGVVVEQAVNGEEAVNKFRNSEDGYYDAILMDVKMPIMNGYEATRSIRAMDRAYAKLVPIIAMTASAFSEDISDALLNGMDDHISKPINFEKLFSILGRLSNAKKKKEEQ